MWFLWSHLQSHPPLFHPLLVNCIFPKKLLIKLYLFGGKSSLYKIGVDWIFFHIGTKEIFAEYLVLKAEAAFLRHGPLASFFSNLSLWGT